MNVGDKIYVVYTGFNRGYSRGNSWETITKIGKKYFYIESINQRFFINTMRADGGQWGSSYQAYLDKKIYDDILERDALIDLIKNYFRENIKLTIEQLRQINKIIKGD